MTGTEQASQKQWIEWAGLMPGIAVGHIVHETRDRITLAMDRFSNDQFRVVSTYPKSGIQRIIRKTVSIQSLKG